MNVTLDALCDDSPLNNSTYDPRVSPENGYVPAEVELWGPRSQVRWFYRFRSAIKAMPHAQWDRFYPDSVEHRGLCCTSCSADAEDGVDTTEDHCCCIGYRETDQT